MEGTRTHFFENPQRNKSLLFKAGCAKPVGGRGKTNEGNMRTSKETLRIGLIVGAVLVVAVLFWWRATKQPTPASVPALVEEPLTAVPEGPRPVSAMSRGGAPAPQKEPGMVSLPMAAEPIEAVPAAGGAIELAAAEDKGPTMSAGPVVLVRPDTVLATVNGVEINLPDVMPVSPSAPGELSVGTDELRARLARAVDREVVIQAARMRRVDLSLEQRQQLEKSRLRAAVAAPPDLSPEEREVYDTKANFDAREGTASLMVDALAAASGGPPRDVTPEMVERYYDAHCAEFGELPPEGEARDAAWQEIEEIVRARLQPEVDAEYQKFLKAMLEDLRARAYIERFEIAAE